MSAARLHRDSNIGGTSDRRALEVTILDVVVVVKKTTRLKSDFLLLFVAVFQGQLGPTGPRAHVVAVAAVVNDNKETLPSLICTHEVLPTSDRDEFLFDPRNHNSQSMVKEH